MKTIKRFLYLMIMVMGLPSLVHAQQNIDIRIFEGQINTALRVLTDARGINFGDYKGQRGLNAWYINLDRAFVRIGSDNSVVIDNIKVTGGADLDLYAFSLTPIKNFKGKIEGRFEITGDNDSGYQLAIKPGRLTIDDISGTPKVVEDVLEFVTNRADIIPDLNINIGNSLLPKGASKSFVSGVPEISTVASRIIPRPDGFPLLFPGWITVRFKLLFDHLIVKDATVAADKKETYVGRKSVTLKPGFWAKAGSEVRVYTANTQAGRSAIAATKKVATQLEVPTGQIMGVGEAPLDEQLIKLFPNPTRSTVSLSGIPYEAVAYQLIDTMGKIVVEGKTGSTGLHHFDMSAYPVGIYTLKLSTTTKVISKKIMKQ